MAFMEGNTYEEKVKYLKGLCRRLSPAVNKATVFVLHDIDSLLKSVAEFDMDPIQKPYPKYPDLPEELDNKLEAVHEMLIEISGCFPIP